MQRSTHFLLDLILLSIPVILTAENPTGEIVYNDKIYHSNIKTAQVINSGDLFLPPVMKLGANEFLTFSFDDLHGQFKTYNYTIIHCDANWQPSDIMQSQYLDGYFEFYFTDVTYSANTFQPFAHFRVTIPNQNIRPTISGNYLFVVYENDKKRPVLTRRFMVYEDLVSVRMEARRPADIDRMFTHHEVDFWVNTRGYEIMDPFQDLKVVLMQNNSWETAIENLKPRFIANNVLDYDYQEGNLFEAKNEFRNFDIKTLEDLTLRISKTELDSLWIAYVTQEAPRNIERYSFWEDINGRFVVRKVGARDVDTDADYAVVDFKLVTPNPIRNGKIYMWGAHSFYRCLPEYEMKWDESSKAYKGQFKFKQGYYNYMYAVKFDGKVKPTFEPTEGNHWEAQNEYMVYVYNRDINVRYDRLVGMSILSAENVR